MRFASPPTKAGCRNVPTDYRLPRLVQQELIGEFPFGLAVFLGIKEDLGAIENWSWVLKNLLMVSYSDVWL